MRRGRSGAKMSNESNAGRLTAEGGHHAADPEDRPQEGGETVQCDHAQHASRRRRSLRRLSARRHQPRVRDLRRSDGARVLFDGQEDLQALGDAGERRDRGRRAGRAGGDRAAPAEVRPDPRDRRGFSRVECLRSDEEEYEPRARGHGRSRAEPSRAPVERLPLGRVPRDAGRDPRQDRPARVSDLGDRPAGPGRGAGPLREGRTLPESDRARAI